MKTLNLHVVYYVKLCSMLLILKIFFEFLKSDMIRLLRGESKTTDFQWPQFDE
ncbi:hypothetical protein ACKLNO_06665 [Neisseriaceae bacterium B1]